MMTLRQIRHFIAVAETGSISAAAQAAFISQSTLTLAIQQLEQEIGVILFNRHAKGMTLTHQGHQFLPEFFSNRRFLVSADPFYSLQPNLKCLP